MEEDLSGRSSPASENDREYLLMRQVGTLTTQLETMYSQLESLRSAHKQALQGFESSKAEASGLRISLRDAQNTVMRLQTKVSDLELMSSELQKSQHRNADAQVERTKLLDEIEDLQVQLKQASENQAQFSSLKSDLSKALRAKKDLEAEIQKLTQLLGDADTQRDFLKQAKLAEEIRNKKLAKDHEVIVKKLTRDLQEERSRNEVLQVKLSEASERVRTGQNEWRDRLKEAETVISRMTEEREGLEHRLDAAGERADKEREEKQATLQKNAQLTEQISSEKRFSAWFVGELCSSLVSFGNSTAAFAVDLPAASSVSDENPRDPALAILSAISQLRKQVHEKISFVDSQTSRLREENEATRVQMESFMTRHRELEERCWALERQISDHASNQTSSFFTTSSGTTSSPRKDSSEHEYMVQSPRVLMLQLQSMQDERSIERKAWKEELAQREIYWKSQLEASRQQHYDEKTIIKNQVADLGEKLKSAESELVKIRAERDEWRSKCINMESEMARTRSIAAEQGRQYEEMRARTRDMHMLENEVAVYRGQVEALQSELREHIQGRKSSATPVKSPQVRKK
eukprot:ANDGO_06683.mRNA.1 hypothetical protein